MAQASTAYRLLWMLGIRSIDAEDTLVANAIGLSLLYRAHCPCGHG